jgi:hypothetical protein
MMIKSVIPVLGHRNMMNFILITTLPAVGQDAVTRYWKTVTDIMTSLPTALINYQFES